MCTNQCMEHTKLKISAHLNIYNFIQYMYMYMYVPLPKWSSEVYD